MRLSSQMSPRARPRTGPRENENEQSETTEGEDDDRDNKKKSEEEEDEEEDEEDQQDVEPKKQNTCNRQFRSTDSDGNKKPNTKKKKNKKKRTKKPCHRRTNQNLPLCRRVVRQPPSKDVLRLQKLSLLETFLRCTKIVKSTLTRQEPTSSTLSVSPPGPL